MAAKKSTPPEQPYVLGTDDDELRRLGLQHQLWAEQAARAWERAGFGPGDTLLDVGCGPGYATFDLAGRVGVRGKILAIDQSPRFIQHVQAQSLARGVPQIAATVGDVERLRLARGVADGAYARWVLCFVNRPAAVLAGVARALKRGGVFVVQDYSNYLGVRLAPAHPVFTRFFQAVADSWRQHGGNPDVGLALPALFQRAGFRVREITSLSRTARPGEPLWHWPDSFFQNYVPLLVEKGLFSRADARVFFREWDRRSRDPAACFVTPPMVEIIAEKL